MDNVCLCVHVVTGAVNVTETVNVNETMNVNETINVNAHIRGDPGWLKTVESSNVELQDVVVVVNVTDFRISDYSLDFEV